MLQNDEIEEILTHFPPLEFAFAYGSGVVEQKGYQYELKQKNPADLPMVDFIFVVEDSLKWHEMNLKMNPSHYSSLIPLPAKGISLFQDEIPAHFWFNAYLPLPLHSQPGRLMKYGVINKTHALADLNSWNNLYLAGRLHKPVRILTRAHQKVFEEALRENRSHAVNTSLLMLPEKFSEMELFLMIASLSYTGDIRMHFGENPKKVKATRPFSSPPLLLSLVFPITVRW